MKHFQKKDSCAPRYQTHVLLHKSHCPLGSLCVDVVALKQTKTRERSVREEKKQKKKEKKHRNRK